MRKIFTIGYNNSTLPMVLSILKTYKITDLIDIRRYNWSELSPFNRIYFSNLLKSHGINYIEEKRLAPSTKLLRQLKNEVKKGKKEKSKSAIIRAVRDFLEGYIAEIGDPGLCLAINLINQMERPCLFCEEEYRRLDSCHRKVLCDLIARRYPDNEFQFIHLKEWDFSGEELKKMRLWEGQNHDLLAQFREINKKYFSGAVNENDIFFVWEYIPKRPKGWALGFFKPPNYIAINKLLDNHFLPKEFIDAVLYHEMLHYKRLRDGKTTKHTEEFYYEFFAFEEYQKIFGFEVDAVKFAMGKIIETGGKLIK